MLEDRQTPGWYIDVALSVVAGICFLFAVASAQEIHSAYASVIDRKVAIGCLALMGLCVIAARRRATVLFTSIALPSVFLFQKFFSSGDVGALWRGIEFLALSFAVLLMAVATMYFRGR
jgi:hypothetical protein